MNTHQTTKNPHAVALGRLGGLSKSPAKQAAVRRNGQLWWKAPEGDEYHTPRVWQAIAMAARAAGDLARAEDAEEASRRESA